MQNITNSVELKDAIVQLEQRRVLQWEALKEQFHQTYEEMKPAHLIKETFNDVSASPNVRDRLISGFLGIGLGYLSRRLFARATGNILRNLMGVMIQMVVTNLITRNPHVFREIRDRFLYRLAHR